MLPRPACVALIWVLALCTAGAAVSAPPKPAPGEYLPVSQIRSGMKGYGLTVFRGTKIERFDVEVIDVLKNSSMANGRDLILIRMKGGPITERGANIIAGMSGSPVYIDNKLIGAVSMGYTFPKEPVAFVTPIEDMFDALDPDLPDSPMLATGWPQTDNGPAPTTAAIQSLVPTPRASGLCNLLTPFFVSGFSPRFMDRLQQEFGPLGARFMVGPGSSSVPAPNADEIKPGSAVGVGIIIGDINVVAVGTVTYRKGNQVLLFGHPLELVSGLQLGAVELPMMSAVVHDVFSGLDRSVKLSSPGQVIGTITRDRPWSVAGVLGKTPKLIPVTVDVRDTTTKRSKTFHLQTVSHPLLSPVYIIFAAGEAIYRMHSFAGDCMAKVKMEVSAEGFSPIVWENTYFSSLFLDTMATDDLSELLLRLYRNAFGPVPVKSVKLTVDLIPGRKTIRVERIYVDKDRVEPGETVKVGVVLRPWKGEPFVRTLDLKIPPNAPEGRTTLSVYGGSMGFVLPTQTTERTATASVSGPAEVNVAQIIRRFLEKDRNDDLVMKLYLNTPSVNIFGERLLNLPSPIASIMASPKSTGFRGERDEVKTSVRMDALVEGVQIIQLTVQRKSLQESGSATPQRSPSQPSTPPSPPSSSRTGTATVLDDGDEDEELTMIPPDAEFQAVNVASSAPAQLEKQEGRPPAPPSQGGQPSGAQSGGRGLQSAPSEARPSRDPGRTTVVWTQRTRSDFQKGESRGAGVTSVGDVRLAAAFKPIQNLDSDTYIWSIQPDGKGGVYLGTGNFGRIYHRDANGNLNLVYDSPELEIHAMAMD
ncbi:MAG: SpoIVB peptidase S55 domain-containing protein, partial [Armatimonadota bacterium]